MEMVYCLKQRHFIHLPFSYTQTFLKLKICFMKSHCSSPFDSKVELEDLGTTSLTEELEELPEVHVVPSVPMRIECGLLKAIEPTQRLCVLSD